MVRSQAIWQSAIYQAAWFQFEVSELQFNNYCFSWLYYWLYCFDLVIRWRFLSLKQNKIFWTEGNNIYFTMHMYQITSHTCTNTSCYSIKLGSQWSSTGCSSINFAAMLAIIMLIVTTLGKINAAMKFFISPPLSPVSCLILCH